MDSKLLSPKYKQALDLVTILFMEKLRADGKTPHVVHLVGVSRIVSQVSDDEDVQIAALLHDVIEDINPAIYNEQQMRTDFGGKITDIVIAVSHNQPKYGKVKAASLYLEQIGTGSQEACLVSAADMLHNCLDLIEMHHSMPGLMKARFGGEKARGRQWFWSERLAILAEKLGNDHPIIKELGPSWQRLSEIHAKIA